MITIVIRAIIIYLLVLILFRIMGKRQLGEMQPFELVLTLIIADLATIPMADISIPVLNGIIPLLTLVVIHYFLTMLSKANSKLGKLISGKPVIVINPNGIDEKALTELDISIDDLLESLRSAGFFKLEEVNYAIMETNGSITVLPKAEFSPATLGDLEIKSQETSIPITLVSEGKIMKENLSLAKTNENFVLKTIKKAKIQKLKDVVVLCIDRYGMAYIQAKKQKFQLIQTEYRGTI